jgi:Fur family transcriptional regulator, iron response regulator
MPPTDDLQVLLRQHGIQPSAHRLAVAGYVLFTDEHPTADVVLDRARAALPLVSRATVYNTLNLFVARGLLREVDLGEGAMVFDPNVAPHHHLIDSDTGRVHDLPFDAIRIDSAYVDVADVRALVYGKVR